MFKRDKLSICLVQDFCESWSLDSDTKEQNSIFWFGIGVIKNAKGIPRHLKYHLYGWGHDRVNKNSNDIVGSKDYAL